MKEYPVLLQEHGDMLLSMPSETSEAVDRAVARIKALPDASEEQVRDVLHKLVNDIAVSQAQKCVVHLGLSERVDVGILLDPFETDKDVMKGVARIVRTENNTQVGYALEVLVFCTMLMQSRKCLAHQSKQTR